MQLPLLFIFLCRRFSESSTSILLPEGLVNCVGRDNFELQDKRLFRVSIVLNFVLVGGILDLVLILTLTMNDEEIGTNHR